jgi:hypothetical protein
MPITLAKEKKMLYKYDMQACQHVVEVWFESPELSCEEESDFGSQIEDDCREMISSEFCEWQQEYDGITVHCAINREKKPTFTACCCD